MNNKFKKGDWVVTDSKYPSNNEDPGAGFVTNRVLEIRFMGEASNISSYVYFFHNHAHGIFEKYLRLATEEEIKHKKPMNILIIDKINSILNHIDRLKTLI